MVKTSQEQKKLRLKAALEGSDEHTVSHKMRLRVKICFQAGKMHPVNCMAGFIGTLFCRQNKS